VLATIAWRSSPSPARRFTSWLAGLAILADRSTASTADAVDLRLWPSAVPLVLAGGVPGARRRSGSAPRESLGAYWELWRGYDPVDVAKWIVYHLADIEVYLAVIPLAVAPIVLAP
jgi:hypothetical protein